MDDKEQHIQQLYNKWIGKVASPKEIDELFQLLEGEDIKKILDNPFRLMWQNEEPEDLELDQRHQAILASIIEHFPSERSSVRIAHRTHFLKTAWFRYQPSRVALRLASAAAVLLFIGIGAYLYLRPVDEEKLTQTQNPVPVQNDILPGSDRAILTLSDGHRIELKEGSETINDSGIAIQNVKGELIYGKTEIWAYNTMTTPRGGQYKLTLPDGTRVWLNAESSITYPTAFVEKTRTVQLAGEAYFEVAKNKGKPFVVNTAKERIAVLGTSFNVNNYADEAVWKTSLLEGSVKINDKVLLPGQAYVNGRLMKTDIQQDLAWKNGIFNFNGISLKTAMNQIARWYDVNVIYETAVPDMRFAGKMGRDLNLSQVLKALDAMGLKFTMNGKNLTVKNNN